MKSNGMGSQFTEVFDQSLWMLQDDEKCIKKLSLFNYKKGKFQCSFVLMMYHNSFSYRTVILSKIG